MCFNDLQPITTDSISTMTIYASKAAFVTLGLEPVTPSNAHTYQDCYICREPLHVNIQTPSTAHHSAVRISSCGHMHGQACLKAWLDTGNSCPTCAHKLFDSSGHSYSQASINSVVDSMSKYVPRPLIVAAIARLLGKQESAQAQLRRAQIEEQQQRMVEEAQAHQNMVMDDEEWTESGEEDFDTEDDDSDFALDEQDKEPQSATF